LQVVLSGNHNLSDERHLARDLGSDPGKVRHFPHGLPSFVTGIRTVKVLPAPGVLAGPIIPPWLSTIFVAIAIPNPMPLLTSRLRDTSAGKVGCSKHGPQSFTPVRGVDSSMTLLEPVGWGHNSFSNFSAVALARIEIQNVSTRRLG
jgi:hypothetical protein